MPTRREARTSVLPEGQNLGAGGIQFRRARELRKGSRKIEDFVGKTRQLVASE